MFLLSRPLLLLSLLLAADSAAAQAAPLKAFPDIQQILEAKRLRIGLSVHDLPPLLDTDDQGAPTGIEVTIAKGLARKLDVKPEFIRTARTPDELVRQTARGDVDIALSSISRTPARAMYVHYSRPYLTGSWVVGMNRARALREGVDCPATLSEVAALAARPDTVGVLLDGASEELLEDVSDDARLMVFSDRAALLEAIESGELLAGMSGAVQLQHEFEAQPAARIKIKVCRLLRPLDYIAVVIRPGVPNLADWIDMIFEDSGLHLDANKPLRLDDDWML